MNLSLFGVQTFEKLNTQKPLGSAEFNKVPRLL